MVYDCRKTFKFLKSLVTLPHDVFILICYRQKRLSFLRRRTKVNVLSAAPASL